LARRLTTILPAMTLAEALETTRIHRVAGLTGNRTACVMTRPCRASHHTLSDVGLIGGGQVPLPGEVSPAHRVRMVFDTYHLPSIGDVWPWPRGMRCGALVSRPRRGSVVASCPVSDSGVRSAWSRSGDAGRGWGHRRWWATDRGVSPPHAGLRGRCGRAPRGSPHPGGRRPCPANSGCRGEDGRFS
jgi:hypothetical protein